MLDDAAHDRIRAVSLLDALASNVYQASKQHAIYNNLYHQKRPSSPEATNTRELIAAVTVGPGWSPIFDSPQLSPELFLLEAVETVPASSQIGSDGKSPTACTCTTGD